MPELHRKFEMYEDPRVKHLSMERTRGEWWWWWWWGPYWRLCNDIYVTFTYDAWGQNNSGEPECGVIRASLLDMGREWRGGALRGDPPA